MTKALYCKVRQRIKVLGVGVGVRIGKGVVDDEFEESGMS
jgi:hypothetical protein